MNKYPTYKEIYKEYKEQKNQIEELKYELGRLKKIIDKIREEAEFQDSNYYYNIPEFSLIVSMAKI